MTNIDISVLKSLREETGVSYSLCSKALTQAQGDIEAAKKLLSKWGVEKAESKASRETKQGAIFSYVHHNKKIASLVELLCETDFVAANADFQTLGADLAMHIASVNPSNADALLQSAFIREPSKTVETLIKEYILKIGENIKIGKFIRYGM